MVAVSGKRIWLDGRFVDWSEARVHVLTHSLHYGLGVFEGIRCYRTADGRSAVFRLGDHLRRLLAMLSRDPELCDVVRGVLQGRPCPTAESFYRLRAAGVLTGASERDACPRCRLYAVYLARHLTV